MILFLQEKHSLNIYHKVHQISGVISQLNNQNIIKIPIVMIYEFKKSIYFCMFLFLIVVGSTYYYN